MRYFYLAASAYAKFYYAVYARIDRGSREGQQRCSVGFPGSGRLESRGRWCTAIKLPLLLFRTAGGCDLLVRSASPAVCVFWNIAV